MRLDKQPRRRVPWSEILLGVVGVGALIVIALTLMLAVLVTINLGA